MQNVKMNLSEPLNLRSIYEFYHLTCLTCQGLIILICQPQRDHVKAYYVIFINCSMMISSLMKVIIDM